MFWNHLFGMLLYNVLVFYVYVKYKNQGNRPMSQLSFTFLIGAFIIYGVWGIQMGDYLSYAEIVRDVYNSGKYLSDYEDFYLSHMEPIYNRLAIQCKGNIHLWRLVWFTVQWLGMGYMLWKLKINNYEAILVFILLVLYSVNGGRVSWGIGYFFLSLYLFLSTHKKRYLLFLILSYWAHTSMILLFAFLPAVFIKIKRLYIILGIFSIPFLVLLLNYIFNEYILVNEFENEYLNRKINIYGNYESGSTIWGDYFGLIIRTLIYRIPLYLAVFKILIDIIRKRVQLSDENRRYISFYFCLFIYTCCALFSNLKSGSFYNRYFIMLYLPSYIVICSLYRFYDIRKLFSVILFILWVHINIEYCSYILFSIKN